MKYIGAHLSISKGIEKVPEFAKEIGADSFALFLKNQRSWKFNEIKEKKIKKFKENLKKFNFKRSNILPHSIYLINLGSPDKKIKEKSFNSFLKELKICNALNLLYLNIHPGSGKNIKSKEKTMEQISSLINKAIKIVKDVKIIIENTAGAGGQVGSKFEELFYIFNLIRDKNRIGFCLDTCHLFQSGYDLRSYKNYEKTFQEFEYFFKNKLIFGIHLNDSKAPLGKKFDRHEHIGKGEIGLKAFKRIMEDERFEEMPLIIETPWDNFWIEEIKFLKKLYLNLFKL